jgi:protein-S-isoprenylcysteine O-methyltransferase Ste14
MPIPPDGYVAIALVAAIGLELVVPLSILPPASWSGPLLPAGLGIALLGLVLEVLAARALSREGATTQPNGEPAVLVRSGPFAWSRNPFYCGMMLLVIGMMLAASLDWIVLLVPLLWLALDRLVIPVEERRLERAFGQDYRTYLASTRRWL